MQSRRTFMARIGAGAFACLAVGRNARAEKFPGTIPPHGAKYSDYADERYFVARVEKDGRNYIQYFQLESGVVGASIWLKPVAASPVIEVR